MGPAVQLDYQRSGSGLPWGGVALLAVSLSVLGALYVHFVELGERADRWEARAAEYGLAGPGARERYSRLSEQELRSLAQEVNSANDILRRLSLPWERLFQAVESAGGNDVTLLTLDPELDKGLVRIGGEAKNLGAVLAYIQRLETQDMFGTVYLQSHQVQQQDPERPVRFALQALLRSAP